MAGAIKIKNKHQILINLDADILEEFKNAIGNEAIGEYFREHQKDVVEEYRKAKKNLSSPNYSAIKPLNNNKQSTIDKYFPQHLQDWQVLKDISKELDDDERIKAGEILLNGYKIMNNTNIQKTGVKIFPLVKV